MRRREVNVGGFSFVFFCKHERLRCIHGDEIIARKFRRCACLDCGKSLDWPMPDVCFFTGLPHTKGKP